MPPEIVDFIHRDTARRCADIAAAIARDPARFPAIPIEAYSVASVIAREICELAQLEYPDMRGRPELGVPVFGPWTEDQKRLIERLRKRHGDPR